MAGGAIFGQRASARGARLSASARRAGVEGGLKVAARTSSADRKREQERDRGRKEVRWVHGNLV